MYTGFCKRFLSIEIVSERKPLRCIVTTHSKAYVALLSGKIGFTKAVQLRLLPVTMATNRGLTRTNMFCRIVYV
jgi:hypothetical protein